MSNKDDKPIIKATFQQHNTSGIYRMCKPQPVQLDCVVTGCKYNAGAGHCNNPAPAIGVNDNGKFICWTKEMK